MGDFHVYISLGLAETTSLLWGKIAVSGFVNTGKKPKGDWIK